LLIHERFFDQIRLRSQAGVDRGVDLEQIKARLALAQSNLIVTEANVENARTDYKAVIGYSRQARSSLNLLILKFLLLCRKQNK